MSRIKRPAFDPRTYGKPRIGAETSEAFRGLKLASISFVTSRERLSVSFSVLTMTVRPGLGNLDVVGDVLAVVAEEGPRLRLVARQELLVDGINV